MTGSLFIANLILWATLIRALLVKVRVLPPTCGRCGLRFERCTLGERVCRCGGHRS